MKTNVNNSTNQRRKAFTLIEMLVAIALASMIAASVSAVFVLLREVNQTTAFAAENAVDRARTHAALQRSFSSLVAAIPLATSAPIEIEDVDGDGTPDSGALDQIAIDPQLLGDLSSLFEQNEDADQQPQARLDATIAIADTSQPPFFELFYEQVSAAQLGTVNLPRLAVTLSSLPIDSRTPEQRAATAKWRGISRAVFELIFNPERANWSLVMTPTDPPSKPALLIDGLRFVEFSVLEPDEPQSDINQVRATSQWHTLYAAYLRQDFPDAVRFYAELESGEVLDWIFETNVITEGGG